MSGVVVVCGNPKPESKTLGVAREVAGRLGDPGTETIIDLATYTEWLFDWTSPQVAAAVAAVHDARVVVVASPVYKATYTGLLKVFLDRFAAGSLQGVTAIPLLVGGAPGHALAVEVHLRPLLVELGATCVTPGLFVIESSIPDLGVQLDNWAALAGPLAVASTP